MAKQMPESAVIYLEEWTLLQRAYKELTDQLDEMWKMVRDNVEAGLKDDAKAHSRILRNLDNAPVKASPGDYWIESEDNSARLSIRIRDPRQSDEAGKFTVELSFPKSAQAEMKKIPEAKSHFEQFVKAENLDRVKWETGYPWTKAFAINTGNLDDTVTEIGDSMRALYKVIVQYEEWISKNAKK